MREGCKTDQSRGMIDHMRAVTISREYGSGGGEIASRLAQRLGWQLIDHEIVMRVAREMDVTEEEVEARDERTEGVISRILSSMQMVDPNLVVGPPVSPVETARAYHAALASVVEAAVAKGNVVIVGRGSQALLAQRRDVLHVRIVAPLESRIAYVMQREGLSQADAQARIQLKERDRSRYLQTAHHLQPEDAHLYDLVVNTGILDLDSVVALLVSALEYKAKQLTTLVEQLGPRAGLKRYAGQPGDLRPPVQ